MRPHLLLTRPRDQALRFRDAHIALWQDKVDVEISPLIEIVNLGSEPNFTKFAAVIFSSANGVKFAGQGNGKRAFCVGQQTTHQAMNHGWDARNLGDTADDLLANLGRLPVGGPLLHLSGRYVRTDIAARLRAMGMRAERHVLYDQIACALSDAARDILAKESEVIVPLFSPRTARIFFDQGPYIANLHVMFLSDAVAAECKFAHPASSVVADAPNGPAMAQEVANCLLRLETFGRGD